MLELELSTVQMNELTAVFEAAGTRCTDDVGIDQQQSCLIDATVACECNSILTGPVFLSPGDRIISFFKEIHPLKQQQEHRTKCIMILEHVETTVEQ